MQRGENWMPATTAPPDQAAGASGSKPHGMTLKAKLVGPWAKYAFILPGMVWVLVFTIFPLLDSLRLSLYNWQIGLPEQFIGFTNYANVFQDYQFWDALRITAIFVAAVVLGTLALGLGSALLANAKLRGIRFFRSIFALPLFTTAVALGYLGVTIFNDPNGPVDNVLTALHQAPIDWLATPVAAFFGILILYTWQWAPLSFLVILAGLQGMPEELYEAARLDTNSSFAVFRTITLPLLKPVIGTTVLLQAIWAFKILDIPYSLTAGGPGIETRTYSFYDYVVGLRNFQLGYAAALAYVLVVIMLIISSIFVWSMREAYD
jgi:multiple sugar transport system permease protein